MEQKTPIYDEEYRDSCCACPTLRPQAHCQCVCHDMEAYFDPSYGSIDEKDLMAVWHIDRREIGYFYAIFDSPFGRITRLVEIVKESGDEYLVMAVEGYPFVDGYVDARGNGVFRHDLTWRKEAWLPKSAIAEDVKQYYKMLLGWEEE